MKYSCVIVAAGTSSRSSDNKLLRKIDDYNVITNSILPFVGDVECNEIILVAPDEIANSIPADIRKSISKIVAGGLSRSESVRNGLKHVNGEFVMIHDGARPYLKTELINRLKVGLEKKSAVIPVIKVVDSLFERTSSGHTLLADRNKYVCSQTPQAFNKKTIERVLNVFKNERDELSVVIKGGIDFELVEGDYQNIKITF